MVAEIKKDARTRMGKSIEALTHELSKLRTGRAHTSLLDHIMVSYYGSEVPLNQVASVSVTDPRTLTVTPWEKKIVSDVEKAIRSSELGLNPVNVGDNMRIPLPALTEDRRRDMTKLVRQEAETARVAIRNIRRDANHGFKQLLKDKEITEDEDRKAEEEIQKLTDGFITRVDQLVKEKEAELMEI